MIRLFTGRRVAVASGQHSSGKPRAALAQRPTVEGMEPRLLLSTTPWIQIDSPRVVEGTSATAGVYTTMEFTVSLSGPTTNDVSVNYQTRDRVALAGKDYIATSGQLTIPAGQTSGTIQVKILPDNIVETNETFYLTLSSAKNGVIAKSTGIGTILNDDTSIDPVVTSSDVTMRRGLSGTREMTFTLSLNTKLDKPVSVNLATRDWTARAGIDYIAKSETVTFLPGEQTKEFKVTVYGWPTATTTKIFSVLLSSTSVTLAKTQVVGLLTYGA